MAGERTIKVRFDGDSSGLKAAAVSGERAISGLDDGVKTTTSSLGKSGVAAQRTATDFATLDRSLTAVNQSIRATQEEIVKTGNTKLFGDLRKQESEFKKLANLRKVFTDEGGPAATGFFAAFSGKVGPLFARLPISGPLGIALGAAVIGVAPALGAAVAGAIVGGAGVGGVIGGAIIASKDPRVKAAFGTLGNEVSTSLTRAAEPFVPAMLGAVQQVRGGFGELEGDLKSIFADSAGFVAPLTEGVMSAVHSIASGLSSLTAVGGPTIRELAKGFDDVGQAIGDVLRSLSDNGPEAAQAMSDFFQMLEGGIRVTGHIVNGLTEFYGILRGGMAFMQGDTETFARFVTNKVEAEAASRKAATALADETRVAYSAAQAVDLLTAAQRRQSGIALTAAESNLAYRSAVAAAAEATDKKRAVSIGEEQALLGLVRAANATTESMDASGTATKVATGTFNAHRKQVIDAAVAMGMSRDKAIRYADSLLAIPKAVNTKVVLDSQQAISGARNIQREIGKIKGKTVTINIRQTGEYGEEGLGAQHGPGRRAWGGPVFSGRQYLVGENGPEILTMGAGGSGFVTPNGAAAPGGFNGTLVVELDGQPFYAYSVRTAQNAVADYAHKQKAGTR